MAYHLIRKGNGNGTSLGQTFSVNKEGRITFAKDLVKELGWKDGDRICLLWNDSGEVPTLCFKAVDETFIDGYELRQKNARSSARVSAKQLSGKVPTGRHRYLGTDDGMILTDCPVTI